MRRVYLSLALALVLTIFFACDKTSGTQAEVIRDCTGTYLRAGNKDHWVCNYRKTDPFATGTMVIAVFEKSTTCNSDFPSCLLLHENEGWIEITKIKKL